MTETDQPKRGRGRPRINPVEGNRRNVTLQVSQDLYDTLKAASDKSGVSVSREMEQRIQNSFVQGDIIAAAVEGATNAAAARLEEQYVDFFGGQDGFTWAKSSADLYRDVMRVLFQRHSIKSPMDITEEFKAELAELFISRLPEVSDLWSNMVTMAQIFEQNKGPIKKEAIDALLKASPELRSKLEGYIKRRTKKDD